MTCCEGALLLVDAFQGVEAQTVANGYNAFDHDLAIIPVINKIDLDYARVDEVVEEIEQQFGLGDAEVQKVSAKEGIGIEGLLEAVIEHVPPPTGDPAAELRAMVFDSHYDEFRGAILISVSWKGQSVREIRFNLSELVPSMMSLKSVSLRHNRRHVMHYTPDRLAM